MEGGVWVLEYLSFAGRTDNKNSQEEGVKGVVEGSEANGDG